MKKLMLITLLFISIITFGQNSPRNNSTSDYNTQFSRTEGGMWLPAKVINTSVEGSPYLFSNWIGKYNVITKSGTRSQIFNLNYNLQTKKLESSISKDSVFQYDLEQFDYIINSKNKYKVISQDQMEGLFLEVFNGPKIKLYKDFNTSIKEASFNPLTQEKMGNDKFVQNSNYYIFANSKYEKINPTKKDILKYLADKKDIIKKYVSTNDLSYDKDDDLNNILSYYNGL